MSVPGLPVSRLVNVTVTLSPPAPQVENVDTCVLLGSSSVIDTNTRMRQYSTITAVATDFGTSAPEYLAAVLWFEQNPAPNEVLIARWAQTATAGQLFGAPEPSLLYTALTAITTGAFSLFIAGVPYTISGLNFSSITNLNGAASVIQTALQVALASTLCVWNGTYFQFVITAPTTGAASTITKATAPTASGSLIFAGQPSNNDVFTVNGTAVTFVTSGATGNQVNIGASEAATVNALAAFLNASADVNISKMTYVSDGVSKVYCISKVTGTAGNAYTLVKTTGTNLSVSGATLSGGSGVDVSSTLGINTASSGAYVANGVAAESALAAVVILDNQFSNQWYGLVGLGIADSDVLAIAAYVEADSVTRHFFGVTTQEGGCLVASDTTNIAYQLKQLAYNHTAVQYSSTNPYAVVSLLARILTTNWTANNTTITLMYKQEPGIVAESLSVSAVNAIEGFNANVFVNYNNSTAIIEMGTTASGQFIDTIIGLDWLTLTLQAAWYAALYETPTKIPQTDAGMHILATVAENTLIEAVNNGLLAPGVWNSGGFGQLSQGDFLSKGFYVYQPSVNSQPQNLRATRVSVPFQIAVKLAGAVQTIDGQILVND